MNHIQTDAMRLPCGGTAYFDEGSGGYGHRCEDCMAVVGSIGQSQHCKDEMTKWKNWAKLGGQDWDYFEEKQ